MSVAEESLTRPEPTVDPRPAPRWRSALATLAVVLVVSVVTWWLLADPQWSVTGLYPQPFTALLFWLLMGTVWVAFTFEWLGPAGWPQPWRGLAGIATTAGAGIGVTVLLGYGWGRIDPSFAAGRAGGAGFTAGNLFVLFGFFFYVLSAVCHGHWPWSTKFRQPWSGFGQLTLVFVPTLVAYAVFALPNVATWASPRSALLSTPTMIGWFYSLVVSTVLTGVLGENLPWRLAGRPARVAAASLFGNALLGTLVYFVLLPVVKFLMGPVNVTALGGGVTVHAAELGVCWTFWMISWANVFGNRPTRFSAGVNVLVRIAITGVLACGTYPLDYFVLAPHVLHEPVSVGTLHGDALGFVDWAILWTLSYVVFLGSYGVGKRPADR
ncbi:hypothetical protein [Amycolatopsis sp. FDAARGOS 1241]|uniref:hypothetical protein n=1 Tax=Amycolatopsis sp. FDAARGOS 1241 TaxID=2778070 RepID=UPI0019509D13|nr:hypothetical protein [Amycolatopsis sp. FDAARGOS 1241]QRP44753.1 hypothetical protein I6J71_36825 [Amycolatopsis sp. FDAARGOS 1241]